MLSQTFYYGGVAASGNSGAPVFSYEASAETNRLITGIYHAGGAVYTSANTIASPIAGVANDLAGGYFNLIFY